LPKTTRDPWWRSRKPCAASYPTPRSSPFVFFLDENLGNRIVALALQGAGALVETHTAHFRPGTRDAQWLLEVGRRGWVVLTKDLRIRNRGIEIDAIIQGGVRAFVLTAKLSPTCLLTSGPPLLRRVTASCTLWHAFMRDSVTGVTR
jgi:hypothetical protein